MNCRCTKIVGQRVLRALLDVLFRDRQARRLPTFEI